jgi:hypothetical protein
MEQTTHTRRDFLRMVPTTLCGLALLGGWVPGAAEAAETPPTATPRPPCPPRTCGGWGDRDNNGICDRSENGGACKAVNCPANKDNPQIAEAKANGAPDGICGLWTDPEKKGFCGVSARDAYPCPYTVCPAHRSKVQASTPAIPAQ